jgi:hypothetical protein
MESRERASWIHVLQAPAWNMIGEASDVETTLHETSKYRNPVAGQHGLYEQYADALSHWAAFMSEAFSGVGLEFML